MKNATHYTQCKYITQYAKKVENKQSYTLFVKYIRYYKDNKEIYNKEILLY